LHLSKLIITLFDLLSHICNNLQGEKKELKKRLKFTSILIYKYSYCIIVSLSYLPCPVSVNNCTSFWPLDILKYFALLHKLAMRNVSIHSHNSFCMHVSPKIDSECYEETWIGNIISKIIAIVVGGIIFHFLLLNNVINKTYKSYYNPLLIIFANF